MNKETKFAAILLIVGAVALGGYYFYKKNSIKKEVTLDTKDYKIELPNFGEYDNIKEVKEYLNDLKKVYAKGLSVLPLSDDELDSNGKVAQEIALKDREFLSDTKLNGKILHNDIMRVYEAMPSNLDSKSAKECQSSRCYIVVKYNFATNTTTKAIVDIDKKRVVKIERYPNKQPDISNRLTQIAKAIALKNPLVTKELGHKPTPKELSMANVRTNLKESPCENKNHLCVAPTFPYHKEQKALWAIVDLTKLKLAAIKWAGLGKTYTPACIDERRLENRYIVDNFCKKDNTLNRDGWSFIYHLTGSDGLELRDIKFQGKNVATSLKIVDWHVAYKGIGADKLDTSQPVFVEGRRVEFVKGENNEYTFGYNDAMGCPMFSTSVVLAFNGPQISPIKKDGKEIGFKIEQDFRNPKWPMACNYRYMNRFEFYKDGSFRFVAINLGRGCSNHAIYRPVMRADINLDNSEIFSLYQNGNWKSFKKEAEFKATSKEDMFKNRFLYKISNSKNPNYGFYIEPNRGQFKDNSRGDHEHIFVTKFKSNEGDTDMLTLGSCCKLDQDGVEEFLNNEDIYGKNIVLWYVPKIVNDDREGHEYCWADSGIDEYGNPITKVWPCIVGPKFVPINLVDKGK